MFVLPLTNLSIVWLQRFQLNCNRLERTRTCSSRFIRFRKNVQIPVRNSDYCLKTEHSTIRQVLIIPILDKLLSEFRPILIQENSQDILNFFLKPTYSAKRGWV